MDHIDLIKNTALQTLKIEAETLNALADYIDNEYVNIVQCLLECGGRIVVTGIGKSAIIAQKIVATFNSTGSPSVYMHAGDAIHGDLGIIQPGDVVICISKSGESPEIKALAPIVVSMGCILIGMTSSRQCYLAKYAHYILNTPIQAEADPNNLAPTASTTAQMAMGDALAMSLQAVKGFTPNDFAKYHPGGALGKQLYLRVSDMIIHNHKPDVKIGTGLHDAILEITARRMGATVVTDEENRLLGIITDGDLRRLLSHTDDINGIKVEDLMHSEPVSIRKDAMAVEALEMLRQYNISQLIVVDEAGNYEGMLHIHDLLREGII